MAALYVIVHHHLDEYDKVMNTAEIPKSGKLPAAIRFTTPVFMDLYNDFVSAHSIPSTIRHAVEVDRLTARLEEAGLLFSEVRLAVLLSREPQRGNPLTPTPRGEEFVLRQLAQSEPSHWPIVLYVDSEDGVYMPEL